MKATKSSPPINLKEQVVKHEQCMQLPKWSVNDAFLFDSIQEVLKTGIQMSATAKNMASSKLKPSVLQAILDCLNRRKEGPPLEEEQVLRTAI